MFKRYAAAAVLLALVPSVALAQTSGTPAERRACARDVSRYCQRSINGGDMMVLSCLQQHRPMLSRACSRVLADHGQ